jgi:TPR repeat protein
MADNDETIDRLFNAGDEAWEDGDEVKAYGFFKQAADLGDIAAMLNVGYFLDEGLGVKADKAAAMDWYRKAYDLGDASAANNIAILHREKNDLVGAADWFAKAAELGDGDALVELAKINIEGLGVPADEAKARDYLEKALALPVDDGEEDGEIDVDQPFISLAGHEEAVEMLAGLTR